MMQSQMEKFENVHMVIDRLTTEANTGTIACVMAQIFYEDGSSRNLNSGGTLIEQVGLLESMKFDLLNTVSTTEEEVDE